MREERALCRGVFFITIVIFSSYHPNAVVFGYPLLKSSSSNRSSPLIVGVRHQRPHPPSPTPLLLSVAASSCSIGGISSSSRSSMTPRPRSIPPLFRSSSSSRRSIEHVRAMVLASMNEGVVVQAIDDPNNNNASGIIVIAGVTSAPSNAGVVAARPRGRSRLRRSYHSNSSQNHHNAPSSSVSRTSNRRSFLRRSLSIASSTACTAPTVASSTTYTSSSPPPLEIPTLTTTATAAADDHRAVVVTVTSDDNGSHDSIEISSSGSSSSRGDEYNDIDDDDDRDDEYDDDDEPAVALPPAAVATKFHSAAYGLEEYNNAMVASRDTNVSPREVYDTIASDYLIEAAAAATTALAAAAAQQQRQQFNRKQQQQQQQQQFNRSTPRALDVGAGAGVSTEVLYNLGYHTIDAVDWSSTAWTKYVIEDETGACPESVRFFAMDDERYLDQHINSSSSSSSSSSSNDDNNMFDVIVFNFAINKSKALRFATSILNKDHGRLLAPINTNDDYWMKQTYTVLDARGSILWSTTDVGAWSVLFQPDVTQDTCSGIWCSQYNGFQKKQK